MRFDLQLEEDIEPLPPATIIHYTFNSGGGVRVGGIPEWAPHNVAQYC